MKISLYRRSLKYLKPHRKLFILTLVVMTVYGATDAAVPVLIRQILNDVFGAKKEEMLYILPLLMVIFAIFRGVFAYLQQMFSATVGLRIIRDIRNDVHDKLVQISPGSVDQLSPGDIISRVTNDAQQVKTAIHDVFASSLRETVRVIALLTVAISLDPVLGAVAFLVFPLAIFPVIQFGKRIRKHSRVGQDRLGGLTSQLHETISGHRVIQGYGLEKYAGERFTTENEGLTNTFLRAEKYGALTGPTNELLASCAMAGVILYGGFSVVHGVRTQGDFIGFITALFLLYDPLKRLGRVSTSLQQGLSAAERLFQFLDTKSEVVNSHDAKELVLDGAPGISFKDVSFRYERTKLALPSPANNENKFPPSEGTNREWAVKDISFELIPGSVTALVGASGGGKSTIAQLLSRVFDPTKGVIELEGKDIKDFTLESLRKSIATVSQQAFLFRDTVYQNISIGRIGASRKEVMAAAELAYAREFIEALPNGFDTVISEQSLSGGERARIALARALLKDAPVLILDEATAALDNESENLIQKALAKFVEGRTVLVIAHRLSTIRHASKIIVIRDGIVTEMGSADELLKSGKGDFQKLYDLQFAHQK
jgi:ATP-binding cassette, subfamily B, bacterial MsbA